MTEAAQLATEYAREQSDARIADKIATIEESGTEIITLSDKTRKEIRDASKGVYESIREVIDPKIYDSLWRVLKNSNIVPKSSILSDFTGYSFLLYSPSPPHSKFRSSSSLSTS